MYEYSDDEDDDDDDIYPFEDSQGTDNQLPIIPSPINLEDSGKSAELQQNLSLLSASAQSKLAGSSSQRQMLMNKRSQQIPLEALLQQVEVEKPKSSNSLDEHRSSKSKRKDSHDSKSSGSEKVYLSPDLKAKADKLTFDICAEFVAKEIAGMFRNSINRHADK